MALKDRNSQYHVALIDSEGKEISHTYCFTMIEARVYAAMLVERMQGGDSVRISKPRG